MYTREYTGTYNRTTQNDLTPISRQLIRPHIPIKPMLFEFENLSSSHYTRFDSMKILSAVADFRAFSKYST